MTAKDRAQALIDLLNKGVSEGIIQPFDAVAVIMAVEAYTPTNQDIIDYGSLAYKCLITLKLGLKELP